MSGQTIDPTITETPNQYPDWQKTIRQGQAYHRGLIEEDKRHWLEQQAIEEGWLSLQLTEALSYFNINIPLPVGNCAVLDRVAFSIRPRGKSDKELLNFKGDALHFDLTIAYQLDDTYEAERDRLEDYSLYHTIAVRHGLADDDWRQEHAQLADAIDKVTEAAQQFMAWVDSRKAAPQPSPAPTLSQQLESLFRQIVRDELRAEEFY